jgi:hypothetical protein
MRLGHGGDRDEFVPRIVEILMNKVCSLCRSYFSSSFRVPFYSTNFFSFLFFSFLFFSFLFFSFLFFSFLFFSFLFFSFLSFLFFGLQNVRSAACGQIHTAALCTEQNGDTGVYVWGGADNGRLGLGDDIQFCKPLPTLISSLSGSRVAAVACGEDFTIACTGANSSLYFIF